MIKGKQIANILFCIIVHILILFFVDSNRFLLLILCWIIVYISHIQLKLQVKVEQEERIAQIRNRRKR